ncbi:MAG: S9 family peptidase [Bacteroidales bacterium]|nr:S9 family peptidase [Bacteroidales bacterium]
MKKLFVYMAFALLAGAGVASAQTQNITLEDIWTKGTFRPKGVYGIRSMADGEHYCTMSRTGIAKYSYATGEKVEDVCLFNAPDLHKKAKPLPPMEGYEFSKDEQKILLSSGFEPIYRHSGVSDYYLYDVKAKSFTKLSNNGKQRLTTLSPDGTKVAFVRDNNLYWMDLATLEEHAITTDGKLNSIIYGTTDWVYEEEFAITKGFQWSPDSKKIAYMRFDESRVKEYNMQMWGALYPEDYKYKYPKAGEDNSEVSLWVCDIDNAKPSRIASTDKTWEYIPRFQWTPDGTLTYMLMNRLQNHMQILTGEGKMLYEEQDKAYVEVPDTWQFITVGKGKKAQEQMLITSERDGYRHIYLYDMQGNMVKQITAGEWEVCEVAGVDVKNNRLYYTSREDGAINKSLYMIGLDGKGKKCLNYTQKDVANLYMKQEDGHMVTTSQLMNSAFSQPVILGTYNATFSNGCKYYICTYSNANFPPVYTLHNAQGKMLKVLEQNFDLQQKMADFGTCRKTFSTFTTSRGTELNCYTILPPDFDEDKQYPVLIYVYGGPGNQQVTNSYGYSDYYWYHMLAEKGYVVACFDGRGTGGRGAAFKKQTYGDMGHMECEDAIEAAKAFGKESWIDARRIGIWGWSFGGYLSTLSLLKGNDVFKMAIAVAPVMNWRYYDNIYTERYLGLPQDNAKGYDENSPLNFAQQLKGNYLLIHGTGDDNVHFQNSAEMVEKLEEAGKQFEFRIYPNKNHSIYDNTGKTRLNLYQLMTDFIERKL